MPANTVLLCTHVADSLYHGIYGQMQGADLYAGGAQKAGFKDFFKRSI